MGVALQRVDKAMPNKMPREIAHGVFWIGDCLVQRHKGKEYHGYNAAFLVSGNDASILVETGHPKDFPVIERHYRMLDEFLKACDKSVAVSRYVTRDEER